MFVATLLPTFQTFNFARSTLLGYNYQGMLQNVLHPIAIPIEVKEINAMKF